MSRTSKLLVVLALAASVTGAFAAIASAKVAEFASEKYAATLTGSPTSPHVFNNVAGPMSCGVGKFSGELAEQSGTVSVAPTYEMCTFVGKAATVAMEGCTYTLEAGLLLNEKEAMGGMSIVCPSGKEIKVTAGECVMRIPPTAEAVGFVDYKNLEKGEFEAKVDAAPLNYSLNNKCGPKEGAYEGGKLTGNYKVKGNNGPVGLL